MSPDKSFNKRNLSAGRGIGLLLAAICTVALAVIAIAELCREGFKLPLLFNLIIDALVVYYGVYGYKVSHGNLMRYSMLGFALTVALGGTLYGTDKTGMVLSVMAAVLIAFIAGRLNRYTQAVFIGLLALALIVAGDIVSITAGDNTATVMEQPADETEQTTTPDGDGGADDDRIYWDEDGPGAEDEGEPDNEDAPEEASVLPVYTYKSASITFLEGDEPEENVADDAGEDQYEGEGESNGSSDAVAPVIATEAAGEKDTDTADGAQDKDAENIPGGSPDSIWDYLSCFAVAIQWASILLIYTARYELHRKAGAAR